MQLLISLIVSCIVFGTLCGLVTNAKRRGWIGVAAASQCCALTRASDAGLEAPRYANRNAIRSNGQRERYEEDEHDHRDTDQVYLAAGRDSFWEWMLAERLLASSTDQVRGERQGGSQAGQDQPDRSVGGVNILHHQNYAVGQDHERGASPGQRGSFGR